MHNQKQIPLKNGTWLSQVQTFKHINSFTILLWLTKKTLKCTIFIPFLTNTFTGLFCLFHRSFLFTACFRSRSKVPIQNAWQTRFPTAPVRVFVRHRLSFVSESPVVTGWFAERAVSDLAW